MMAANINNGDNNTPFPHTPQKNWWWKKAPHKVNRIAFMGITKFFWFSWQALVVNLSPAKKRERKYTALCSQSHPVLYVLATYCNFKGQEAFEELKMTLQEKRIHVIESHFSYRKKCLVKSGLLVTKIITLPLYGADKTKLHGYLSVAFILYASDLKIPTL